MNRIRTDKKEKRNLEVLSHVVRGYVSSAMPVSSKSVANLMGDKISSATVRNIMADLEDMGYIEQPHTSAGRVPTDTGYRYYVDLVERHISAERRRAEFLALEYKKRIRSIEELLERTTSLISRELHNAGFVMWPSMEDLYLKRLELVKLRAETVLAVVITMTGAIRNYIVKLEEDLEASQVDRIENFINACYGDSMISHIAEDLRSSIPARYEDEASMLLTARQALGIVDEILDEDIENEVYLEGMEQFMDEPEFQDMGIARRMMNIFSDRKHLLSLMRTELPSNEIRVYIGRENPQDMLRGCSVITSGYGMHGRTVGRFGVLGPRRMDYSNAIGTVRILSDIMSAKLEELNG